MNRERVWGFTLVELMIVVAVIALLSAIALPTYMRHQQRAAESACMAEMKNYASFAVAALANNDIPPVPLVRACRIIEEAGMDSITITGTPKSPGIHSVTCDMRSAACDLNP